MGIEDANDEWNKKVDNINKRVLEAAVEHGYTDANKLDVVDLFLSNGTNCSTCQKGLRCTKHKFIRQN